MRKINKLSVLIAIIAITLSITSCQKQSISPAKSATALDTTTNYRMKALIGTWTVWKMDYYTNGNYSNSSNNNDVFTFKTDSIKQDFTNTSTSYTYAATYNKDNFIIKYSIGPDNYFIQNTVMNITDVVLTKYDSSNKKTLTWHLKK